MTFHFFCSGEYIFFQKFMTESQFLYSHIDILYTLPIFHRYCPGKKDHLTHVDLVGHVITQYGVSCHNKNHHKQPIIAFAAECKQ